MGITEFLRLVLPSRGALCGAKRVTTRDGKRVWANLPFPNINMLSEWLTNVDKDGEDVWMALASYAQLSDKGTLPRTHENVAFLRSLWVDLDVGGKDNEYKSQREGIFSLLQWCVINSFPAPTLISSGNGVHAYWPLDRDLTRAEWEPLSHTLRARLQADGILLDPSAHEAARVLRPVGTRNFKTSPAKPVRLIQLHPVVPYDTMLAAVGPTTVTVRPVAKSRNGVAFPDKPRLAGQVFVECQQVRECGTQTEPVWRAGLSVLRLCQQGVKAAHLVSQLDPRYNATDVDAKLDTIARQQADGGMPTLCTTFNILRPGVCPACPHWGKVLRGELKTPLTLGDPIPLPVAIEHAPAPTTPAPAPCLAYEEAMWVAPHTVEKLVGGTTLLAQDGRYQCITPQNAAHPDQVGTVWVKRWLEEEQWKEERVYISNDVIVPIHCSTTRDISGNVQHATVWRVYSRGHGLRYSDVVIPDGDLHAADIMRKIAGFGITIEDQKLFPKMGECMRGFLANARAAIAAIPQAEHVGWVDDTSFVLGSNLYHAPQPGVVEVQAVPHNPGTAPISDNLRTQGDFQKWLDAYNVFARPGQEHMAFASFATWGAPLMRFTSHGGITVSLFSPHSGHGKSTLQRVAAAAWGDPGPLIAKLLGSRAGTTQAAFMSILGMSHSIPIMVDEISQLTDADVSMMLHSVSSGEERRRSDASGRVRPSTGTWSTICLMSSNKSLREQLANEETREHDALLKRLLEIQIPETRPATWREDRLILDQVTTTNFGFAGEVYAKFLVANAHLLRQKINDRIDILIDAANGHQSERFWFAGAACMLVGAELAAAAGLHNINVNSIQNWFLNVLLPDQRRTSSETTINASLTLGQFFADNLRATLVVKRGRAPESMVENAEYRVRLPAHGAPIWIRAEVHEQWAYISCSALREWCSKHRTSYEGIINGLRSEGILIKDNCRKAMGGGVSEMMTVGGSKVRCIHVAVKQEDLSMLTAMPPLPAPVPEKGA